MKKSKVLYKNLITDYFFFQKKKNRGRIYGNVLWDV